MISARTKAALAAAKARGTALGGYRGGPNVDNRLGTAVARQRADEFAARVGPTIEAMQSQGLSLGAIAEQLNERQIRTARGGRWVAMSVKRVIERRAAH